MGLGFPWKLFACFSFLLFAALSVQGQSLESASSASPTQVNVYCTNNRDGTGSCFNESTNAPFDCVAVQGTVVPCKSPAGVTYECQWLGHHELACSATLEAGTTAPISTDVFTGLDPQFPQLQQPPPPASETPSEQPLSASEFAETFQPSAAGVDSEVQQSPGLTPRSDVETGASPGGAFLNEFKVAP
mgnify:CR=1 FL=1|tara:strand:+ start:94 stop:657 length:564 start_codon:yes stop_codon:yes gene_type:complete